MAAKKARKRAYIPPSSEVVHRKERTTVQRTHRSQAARGAGRGAQYEYPQPSLKRTAKRLPIYFVLIFALQYFFAGQDPKFDTTNEKLIFSASSAAFVTVLFAPFMHVMDRFAYNRYLRRTGQAPAAKATDASSKSDSQS